MDADLPLPPPPAPPPPGWPGSSPPPIGTPPHRPRSNRMLWVLVGALVASCLLLLGLFVYLNPPPGSNCNEWYVYCPIGPGATPLGTALEIGNGTGACVAGNASMPSDCAYSFLLNASPPMGSPPTTVPSASILSFSLQNSAGAPLNSNFLVVLTDRGGGWIGTWNSSNPRWTLTTVNAGCGVADCLSAPLESGDTLLLKSVPLGGLPYSRQGDWLVADAEGDGFSGTVAAPIS